MSDLISRSELISHIEREYREYGEDYDVEQILGDIEDMQTAYDINKVVEDLEEAKHEICLSDEDLEHYQNGIDNAIEIVKQGVIPDDVCKWRLCDEGANMYMIRLAEIHIF